MSGGAADAFFTSPLRTLVEQSAHPLRGWDVDFLLLQISPAAVPCFSPWWTLGGSAKRVAPGNRSDPFPEGLELANEPFTIRAQPPEGMTPAQVAEWGKQLLEILKQQSPTGNPSLVPPLDVEVAAKQLAVEPRMCSGTALARALIHPTLAGFKIFIARYGMKVDAPEFFNRHLMEAITAMAEEIGEEAAMEMFHNMVVDWATQAPLSGRVLLLTPLPASRHQLSWPAKLFSYPMFGRTGGGAGGLTLVSRAPDAVVGQQKVAKVCFYAAGWAHHLKGAGLPPTMVPAAATNGWLVKQRPKLQSILVALQNTRQFSLGGLRIEVRTNGAIPTWPELQRWLEGIVHEAMTTCLAGEVEPGILIAAAQQALDAATASRVFSCIPAEARRQITHWRRMAYYRLIHLFGIVNAKYAKSSFKAEMEAKPWGDPAQAPAASGPSTIGVLHVNPPLPPGLPLILCPSPREATAAVVSRIGQALGDGLPWAAVCNALHLHPRDAERFSTVARLTKWRRFPNGRSRGVPTQFTATTLQGGGMVGPLGDHLMLATINLVALGLHDRVLHW